MYRNFWSVFDEMERLRRDLDSALRGDVRWEFPFSRVSFLPGRSARAYPLINISENPEQYTIEAMAPGIDPKSIEISVTGNQLTIAGEKLALPDAVAAEKRHRVERAGGRFCRTIQVPGEFDRESVRAEYNNGILKVSVPKAESAKPRTIEVSVG